VSNRQAITGLKKSRVQPKKDPELGFHLFLCLICAPEGRRGGEGKRVNVTNPGLSQGFCKEEIDPRVYSISIMFLTGIASPVQQMFPSRERKKGNSGENVRAGSDKDQRRKPESYGIKEFGNPRTRSGEDNISGD